MSLNFVPCVAWVARGIAAPDPEKLQLSPEELKRLVEEAKGLVSQSIEEDSDEIDDENEDEITEENEDEITEENDSGEEEDDFDARYNLDSYDNNDDQNPLFTINDIAVHVDNRDDEYVTDEESEGDLEEKEDFAIKDSDNLLLVGHVEESSSVLEIHIYNQEEDSFYVHHDIVLPAYPLAIEWLDFHPSDEKPGNYAAIGDMTSVIKIWDLDVVDILEPDYKLGINPEKKKAKKIKKEGAKFHSDAVLSLSWNKLVRNLLASGSADSSVIIWDLEDGSGLNQLSFHSNKVQTLQWHPSESPFLLSGCTDGYVKLYDCRTDGESKSWKVEGEIERVLWNISDSFKFFCSTDQGCIHSVDMRKDEIVHSFNAHKEAVTGLDISPLKPEILISASMDRTLKVWDINSFNMLKSMKLKVGSIYTAKAAPDLDLTVAVGGNYSSNSLKVINIFGEQKKLKDPELDETEQSKGNNFNRIKKDKNCDSNDSQWSNFSNSGVQQSERNTFKRIKKEKNYDSKDSQWSNFPNSGVQQSEGNDFKRIKKEKNYGSNDRQWSNFPKAGVQQSEGNDFKRIKKEKKYGSNNSQWSNFPCSGAQQNEGNNFNRIKKEKNCDSDNSQWSNFPSSGAQQSEGNNFNRIKKEKNYGSNKSQGSNFPNSGFQQSEENNLNRKKKKGKKNYGSKDSQVSNFPNSEIQQSEEHNSERTKKNKHKIYVSNDSQGSNFLNSDVQQSDENNLKRIKKKKKKQSLNSSDVSDFPDSGASDALSNIAKAYKDSSFLNSDVQQSEENNLKRIKKKKKKQSLNSSDVSDFPDSSASDALSNIAKTYKNCP